jgi:hypothetical protein
MRRESEYIHRTGKKCGVNGLALFQGISHVHEGYLSDCYTPQLRLELNTI